MRQQLPLEFKFNNELTFASFVRGSNAELLDALQKLESSAENPLIYYWGRQGVGKTHLLQAICQSPDFANRPVAMISLGDINQAGYSPLMLEGLEQMALVCIDDVHSIAGQADWENALFHFYNRARDQSTPLVITGNLPPAQLAIELNDLKTRLGWCLIVQLHDISDEEKLLVLRQRAKLRGMELNNEVGEFLLRRHSREMNDLMLLLNELDKASLTEQRRLTIPFVKQFLENKK